MPGADAAVDAAGDRVAAANAALNNWQGNVHCHAIPTP
jgi:hypothetical protein